jgi:hypothetical protein
MKAIWQGMPYVVVDDDGDGVFVEAAWPSAAPERHYVSYSDRTLVVDPTDTEWSRAEQLPMES